MPVASLEATAELLSPIHAMTPPNHFEAKKALLGLTGLRGLRPGPGFISNIRERLLALSWPEESDFPSQGGQDWFVDILLRGKRNGYFIEIGANDGETFSNSLFFEEKRGWTGACVEPNPAQFEKLIKRRSATCLQKCLGSMPGTVSFPVISDPSESLLGKIGASSNEGTIEVEQLDLPGLFEELEHSHIDFLSIDTEGVELEILETLQRSSIRPLVIAVEQNASPRTLDTLLHNLGYRIEAKVYTDRIYSLRH